MNRLFFASLYEANLPTGRKEFCPRVGIYKPLAVSMGLCYGRPALMMKARWKPTVDDSYLDDFIVEVQLESLKLNANLTQLELFNEECLVGMEIIISAALQEQNTRRLVLEFEMHPIKLAEKRSVKMLDLSNIEALEEAIENERNSEVDFPDPTEDPSWFDGIDED